MFEALLILNLDQEYDHHCLYSRCEQENIVVAIILKDDHSSWREISERLQWCQLNYEQHVLCLALLENLLHQEQVLVAFVKLKQM